MAIVEAEGLEPIAIIHCGRQQQQPHPIAIGERKNWWCFTYHAHPPFAFHFSSSLSSSSLYYPTCKAN